MTPPDTPFAALPAAPSDMPPLRATDRAVPPPGRRWRRLLVWMVLLSLALHITFLTVLSLVHRRVREAAESPSFQVLFQPPTAPIGKRGESKPTELPGATETPPPAPPPQPVAPREEPVPPTPEVPEPQPVQPQVMPPQPVQPQVVQPPPPSAPPQAAPPQPAPPVPQPAPPQEAQPPPPSTLPPVTGAPAPSAEFAPSSPAPPLAAPKPLSPPPPSTARPLPPAVPAPTLPPPPKPVPAAPPQVRLSLPPIEIPPPFVEPLPRPQPAPPRTAQPRPRAFPAPMDTTLGATEAPEPTRNRSRGTGGLDLRLGKATLNSNGAPPRDTESSRGNLVIHGAHVGKDWEQLLEEWWREHGYYPQEAARRGEDGTVTLRVVADRYGHVKLVEMESTSGSQWLDMGAQSTFRNAQLPPPPPSMPENEIDMDITIHYILIRR